MENTGWRWHERENLRDGKWIRTGVTTPVNKHTGKLYREKPGYLDKGNAPETLRLASQTRVVQLLAKLALAQVDEKRKSREGRPPSQWLRSLKDDELSIWLKTTDIPEVSASGMTFLMH